MFQFGPPSRHGLVGLLLRSGIVTVTPWFDTLCRINQPVMQLDISADSNSGPPRKITAVGTVGEVGQLFTVYEKNWKCTECGQENYASRPRCYRCRGHKPEGQDNYVLDPALQAIQSGQEIPWKEAIDPNSYQIYYYNTQTGETKWERPVELGPAPHATGWFGRGQSGTMAAQMYSQRNAMYLSRPARKQKEFIDPKNYHLEGANEYNIWYGRFLGDHWEQGAGKDKAADRCVLDKDAGYTKADKIVTEKETIRKKDKRFFCVHFSHGTCAKGKDCTYYHRIPTLEDDARTDELFDCFGRQRHNKHRDDMTGVGSFMKPCRTLFVGGLQKHKYDTPQAHEAALWKYFGEWGELENVNVIQRLSIAFVRFRVRTSAEFAKEAMANQSLDQGEILDIRWAHDDPNPVAQDAIGRADKDALFALMQAKGISMESTGFQYPAEYSLPAAKRICLENGVDLLQQHPDLAYPDTDVQYEGHGQVGQQSAVAGTSAADGAISADTGEGTGDSGEACGAAGHWEEFVDDESGATYFYNAKTGVSSWGQAPPTAS